MMDEYPIEVVTVRASGGKVHLKLEPHKRTVCGRLIGCESPVGRDERVDDADRCKQCAQRLRGKILLETLSRHLDQGGTPDEFRGLLRRL